MNKEIFFSEPFLPPLEEYGSFLQRIWNNRILASFGPIHNEFESRLSGFLSAENVLIFTNGHTALETAVGALEAKGEIITSPFTFISTVNAIARNGAKPVFCDVCDNLTLDPDKAEQLISEKTAAILPVHTVGNICDVERFSQIEKKYHIPVIYDSAHAFGVRYKGRDITGFGKASMLSFHATKVFNSAEGGALVCNDQAIYAAAKRYRFYGMEYGNVEKPGLNGKMHELTAALGLCNLKHIASVIDYRKKLTDRYKADLADIKGITFRIDLENIQYNYIYFYIIVDNSKYGISSFDLCTKLNCCGIHAKRIFPQLINNMDRYRCCRKGTLDNAAYFLEHIVMLPLHTNMDPDDVDRICRIIKNKGEEKP